jgi:brefeldin A-inhibited guanine nucleotide-exchange protein
MDGPRGPQNHAPQSSTPAADGNGHDSATHEDNTAAAEPDPPADSQAADDAESAILEASDSPPNANTPDSKVQSTHFSDSTGGPVVRNDVLAAPDALISSIPPPTPPAKTPTFSGQIIPGSRSLPPPSIELAAPPMNGHRSDTPPSNPSSPAHSHNRSLTTSHGRNVSIVLISSALETIMASKEAKRSAPFRESAQHALDMIRSGHGAEKPREIIEPLRLACETRNEKLMIASLDCISKLISYSFFVESAPLSQSFPSPPASPSPNSSPMTLVDLVVHTITACHTETTPEAVSLQIVKALLSLVLSSTILVHHSALLKAVRTVYNVFLLSTDAVNQMVAQGGLTQMVHHVFTRCQVDAGSKDSLDASSGAASRRPSLTPIDALPTSPLPSIVSPPIQAPEINQGVGGLPNPHEGHSESSGTDGSTAPPDHPESTGITSM